MQAKERLQLLRGQRQCLRGNKRLMLCLRRGSPDRTRLAQQSQQDTRTPKNGRNGPEPKNKKSPKHPKLGEPLAQPLVDTSHLRPLTLAHPVTTTERMARERVLDADQTAIGQQARKDFRKKDSALKRLRSKMEKIVTKYSETLKKIAHRTNGL